MEDSYVICGNSEVIKPLIILEISFSLGKGDSNHILQEVLLFKTNKRSTGKSVFCQWFENSVITHN